MPIAVPLAIGLGAAAVGQVASSAIGARGAKDAARIQSQSADKALAVNERTYRDQQQLMQPYVQAGQDSLARLMAEHWGGPAPSGPGASMTLANMGRPRNGAPMTGQAIPRTGSLADLARPRGVGPTGGMSLADMAGMKQQGPNAMPAEAGMVLLEAPDGSGVRPVPLGQVAQWIARGARQVG